jgi:hypothetical protein
MWGLPRLVLNEVARQPSFVYARIYPKDERFECSKRRAPTEDQGGRPSTGHPKSPNQPRREMHPRQTFRCEGTRRNMRTQFHATPRLRTAEEVEVVEEEGLPEEQQVLVNAKNKNK